MPKSNLSRVARTQSLYIFETIMLRFLMTLLMTRMNGFVPESASYEIGELVTCAVSSITISSAVVALGPKLCTCSSVSITDYHDYGDAVLNARLPLLTLDQAVLCFPPSSSCILSSTAVDAWLNVTSSDNSLVKFVRRFQLRLPARPTVNALGNLVVYINTPSITAIPCQR